MRYQILGVRIMYLFIDKNNKDNPCFYVHKKFRDESGKSTTKVVENLGRLRDLEKVHEDPLAWAKEYIAGLNRMEKENRKQVLISYDPGKLMDLDEKHLYEGGYLFLQKIYYELGLDKICRKISGQYKFEYDLNDILKKLLFGRILFPASKARTYEESRNLLEGPNFEQHDVYRALEVLIENEDYIQSELYRNSADVVPRNNNILYYDCTNFFFEIEEEKGIRKYGYSKESRPNPIVEMGLFTDGNGIPLAFCIHPGNTNEQTTLKPLEKKILTDFGKAKVVVCTDAGLSGEANRKFNDVQGRAFITVQSLKRMSDAKKAWALNAGGWKLEGSGAEYDLNELLSDEENIGKYHDSVFYKESWFKDNDIEQRYIVTFSLKYRDYLRNLRERQLQRAQKKIDTGAVQRKRQTDPLRFVDQVYFTDSGEVADHSSFFIDETAVKAEEVFDGYYCIATNLDDPVADIIRVNSRRWEIEESFRIMKTDLKSRPVYLQKDERIKAHFLTCFLSLYLYRILEKKLEEKYTTDQILSCLRSMRFQKITGEGYVPVYTRTELTDALHTVSGFRTDYQICTNKMMKETMKLTKLKG